MDRRDAIVALGTAAATGLAGCLDALGSEDGGDGAESGDESGAPRFEAADREALLLPLSTFPSDWRRADDVNQEFDAVYLNDERTVVVLVSLQFDDNAADATERMVRLRNRARDPRDIGIGDDAFWATAADRADTYVRLNNLVAAVAASRRSGGRNVPATSWSQQVAGDLVAHWRDVR